MASHRSPIVFLDVDGVLNSAEWHREGHRGLGRLGHFDPAAVARLNRLTQATGAQIVVSSSWRQYGEDYCRDILRQVGVAADVIGVTPILDDGSEIMRPVPRGQEIQAWLDAQPSQPDAFVILDDDNDMEGLRHRFVRTRHAVGLTDADVEHAKWLLGRQQVDVLAAVRSARPSEDGA